jgi:hypothetical protein
MTVGQNRDRRDRPPEPAVVAPRSLDPPRA